MPTQRAVGDRRHSYRAVELHERAQFDFLLDNTAGSCFVLSACEKRTVEAVVSGRVEQVLLELAVRTFADVLTVEVEQGIQLARSGPLS